MAADTQMILSSQFTHRHALLCCTMLSRRPRCILQSGNQHLALGQVCLHMPLSGYSFFCALRGFVSCCMSTYRVFVVYEHMLFCVLATETLMRLLFEQWPCCSFPVSCHQLNSSQCIRTCIGLFENQIPQELAFPIIFIHEWRNCNGRKNSLVCLAAL